MDLVETGWLCIGGGQGMAAVIEATHA